MGGGVLFDELASARRQRWCRRFTQGPHQQPDSYQNNRIGCIENASLQRANAQQHEIGNQAIAHDAVDQVAGATGPNQREADEAKPVQAGIGRQVRKQRQQTESDTQRQNDKAGSLGKARAQAEKRTGILGEPQFAKTAGDVHGPKRTELSAGKMLGGLVATNGSRE
jgi:hypothetical protein